MNRRNKMDGLKFLKKLPPERFPVAFFDPQYRGILDKMKYGNEGKTRGKHRASLEQMNEKVIHQFLIELDRVLIPSGHVFLWIDKFHLCEGFSSWIEETELQIVDMVCWNKKKLGMGYRTRRITEYCAILQKSPKRAKGVWLDHSIPDSYEEKLTNKTHTHAKPIELQKKLLSSVSNEKDIIIDPAAGSFSVMEAATQANRNFLGCDING